MTRVNLSVTQIPTLKVGLGGNYYVLCILHDPLKEICLAIEKSTNSIYYHDKHNCWVFRVRSTHHKTRLNNLMKK